MVGGLPGIQLAAVSELWGRRDVAPPPALQIMALSVRTKEMGGGLHLNGSSQFCQQVAGLFTAQRRCGRHCIFEAEAPLSPLTVGLPCPASCFACAHLSGRVPYGGGCGGGGGWAEATDAFASQLQGRR